ncbi:MAG: tetratricopeptide repeat protein [Candidatus Sericytochromatia bacterium]|nr:tetratricopeptide repeat protein [Candidatus Sericytochromatia bacterium]
MSNNQNYMEHYEKAFNYFAFENNLTLAIKEYKKSITINPEYAQAYYDLGYIYELKNKKKQSQKYYMSYLSFNPHDKKEIKIRLNLE